ncbi:sensor histidine kinase [Clostridium sp. DL1XJH146]
MVWLIFSILIIIMVILLAYIILIKRDIKYVSNQIKWCDGDFTTIRMKTLDKELEELVININNSYELCNKKNIEVINKEIELRKRIANISHDLRTPLTSMMGYLELLKEERVTIDEKNKYLEIITKRTEVLQALIHNFYDLSRIELDEEKFDLKSLNLREILSESIVIFYNEFQDNNINPVINIEEDIPNIISDENAVSRIFSNLINNILKHGEKEVFISLRKDKNGITSEFTNAAPNLNDKDIELIFNSFYTKNPTRNDENTGLGLYIVKTLVERLGNKIDAKLIDGMITVKITWIIR